MACMSGAARAPPGPATGVCVRPTARQDRARTAEE